MNNDAKIIMGLLIVIIMLLGGVVYIYVHQLNIEAIYNETQAGQINGLSDTIKYNCK